MDRVISTSLIHDMVSLGCAHAHFGLEADSPAMKIIWVWAFSEMQFRDSVPRRFHHTILRIRSPVRSVEFQVTYFLVNRRVGTVELSV